MQSTSLNKKNSITHFGLEVFARIWALWGLISFVVTFLIIFIPSMLSYLFPEKKGQDYFIAVSRYWMKVWLILIGCPVKVTGRELFKKGVTYIVVYNHNAFLDVPLSAPFIPAGNKTIAKASFAKVPIFGLFYKRGSVLVDRDSEVSRRQSYDGMMNALAKGMHMCLYPEGTRNRTKALLKSFHGGAFKLAVDTKKEIMPCIIYGTKKAMPINKKFYLLPTKLTMDFLPPVASENIGPKELRDKIFNIMLNALTDKEKAPAVHI
jgi:1-acyl-sn-glycerol-3-phosphate acyltransferase